MDVAISGENEYPEDRETSLGKYLTTSQVADIFQVQAETVRDWIAKGHFDGCIQIDSYWRIPESSVKQFAQDRHGPPKEN